MAISVLPERISRLNELAYNLWWSWNDEARRLFRALDYPLWRTSGHNPVKQLRQISSETLQAAADDEDFLALYDSVIAVFDAYISNSDTWFNNNHSNLLNVPVAYFSMEYALHNSLPIYAGGLGILAGDICKEASDSGIPMVAIGFMYPQGYFHQHISTDGWQEEVYRQLDFEEAAISRVLSNDGKTVVAEVQLGDDSLAIGVWRVRVGCTNIYLLDTNIEQNPTRYRQQSARLYVADSEQRIQQEVILGIGGVRVLRALNINPGVWHANEGHTAFMMLERLREEVTKGVGFAEAMSRVQKASVFTTHTPVLAGHDIFPAQLVEKYFRGYWESLGIDRDTFFQLGRCDNSESEAFNMTVLALKMADQRCAVSQLHGKVSRKMWHGLWPELPEDQVPISHITNGVHVPSWIAPELLYLLRKYLGEDWMKRHDDEKLWERLMDIPDDELWAVRKQLNRKLIAAIRERVRRRWVEDYIPAKQLLTMGTLLDSEVLTIAFTRRFAEYKRPTLIFRDVERLKKIVNNRWRPVQIIFAGKSHPADLPSKRLLQQVYTMASDPGFQGRIAFVEDYDMHLARFLVHGVDVWLNTPCRLREASGTSGMKATLNGVLHFSVRDGWWQEGYNGGNGWAIGSENPKPEEEDREDAEAFYRLLEEEVVPLYYTRDRNGVPQGWMRMVKEAMRSVVPLFCARRMLRKYTEQMYRPAAQTSRS